MPAHAQRNNAQKCGNNSVMGKFADFILIQFMVFLAVFTGCALAELALPVCIIAGILSAIAAGMPWIAVSKRDKKEGFISYSKWCFLCKADGDERLKSAAVKVLSITRAVHEKDGIIFADEYAVAAFARFAPLSLDAAAAVFRKCKALGVDKIHILSPNKEPKALALGGKMRLTVKVLSFRKFYRIACDAGVVPSKSKSGGHRLAAFKTALPLAFTRGAAVRFCLAAAVLALLSYLTPMQNYYLIVSSVALLLSFISLALSFKGYTEDEGPLSPPPPPLISPKKNNKLRQDFNSKDNKKL